MREQYAPTNDYDLAIIGSGGAAFGAAIKAQQFGARVIMIERGTLGGTCVNIGCVPSKTLLRGAERFYQASHQPFAGVKTEAISVDYGAMVVQKDKRVARLRQDKYADLITEYGWELVQGEATFTDPTTLTVGKRTIRADAYLIATGSRPAVPAIPGLAETGYLTSTSAMELETLPSSIVVIGAGYVALELGQLFRQLGSAVTILQRGECLLPGYEPEVAAAASVMLDRLGTHVLTSAQVRRIERTSAGRVITVTRGGQEEQIEAEQILVATGRQPNIEALNLVAAGVQIDQRGAVVTDTTLRTANPRIFAAGDVTLPPQFVYVAAYEGGLAAENALGAAKKTRDLSALPCVIFTDPPIAAVGLTREQARAEGYTVKSAVLPVSAVPRAQVNHETEGVFILIADAASGRLLGAQIVASHAGDVIYTATLAVKHHLTISNLVESFAPYLTMAEGLKLAAISFEHDISKLSCCAV